MQFGCRTNTAIIQNRFCAAHAARKLKYMKYMTNLHNRTTSTTTDCKDLYALLGFTREEVDQIIKEKEKYYLSYPIVKQNPKKGKVKKRYIDAPQSELKICQDRILKKILYRFSAHPIAYGFVKGRSPKTAAEQHIGAQILVCLDIKNFFNTIKYARVFELLKTLLSKRPIIEASDSNARILAELLTYRGRVPQGAPTSPTISNLVCLKLDKQLSRLQPIYKCTITRYADDLSISSKENPHLAKIIPTIVGLLKDENFQLNKEKTRVLRKNRSMRVVGIVVNERLNVPHRKWREFRAKLHNLKMSKKEITPLEYQKLRGYCEWVSVLNPTRGQQFLTQLGKIPLKNA